MSLAAHQDPLESLTKAVAAYQEALRFRTPERAPLDYAMTQNDLGNAYRALAAHQDPLESLTKAVAAYQEALRFYSPERAPLSYAMTQNNLGNAYRALAAHQDPLESLTKAVAAYQEALRFYSPERTPLSYAMTQNNLGNAYITLAAHASQGQQRAAYFTQATDIFLQLEEHSPGKAAYNLACISAITQSPTDCHNWLQQSHITDNLPSHERIEKDTDLDPVHDEAWFVEFLDQAFGND